MTARPSFGVVLPATGPISAPVAFGDAVDAIDDLGYDDVKIRLTRSTNHYRNFIDCVKSRQPTITPVETAHHSTIPGHLGLISMLLGGRKLRWDVQKEEILGDSEATALMTRHYRSPYRM